MDWSRELSNRVQASRGTGVVHVALVERAALGPHGESRMPATRTADALAHTLGLRELRSAWRALSREEARAALLAVLTRDLAYDSECMPAVVADELVDEFLGRFDLNAEYLTNGAFPPADAERATGWRGSWTPLTDATFDTGVVVVDGMRAGLLWLEDED